MALPDILFAAGDRIATTTTSSISNSDLSIPVSSTAGLNTSGGAVILDKTISAKREIVYYTSISGSNLIIPSGGRGLAGTSAVSHDTAASVNDVLISEHINTLADYLDVLSDNIKESLYPVGSIYTNSSDSTNPGTLLGFGTWTAFGAGRVLVGLDGTQTEFDTAEETGGAKTHTLVTGEMPSHTHTQNAHSHSISDPGHTHSHSGSSNGAFGSNGSFVQNGSGGFTTGSSTTGITVNNATATNQNTGGGGAHNNLQPYIVVYMWKRTA